MTCPVCELDRTECPACFDPCPTCQGAGEIADNPGWPDPQHEQRHTCPTCQGEGMLAHDKRCPRCDQVKPTTDFYRAAHKASGHDGFCKPCRVDANRESRLRNVEATRARRREYRAKNAEAARVQLAAWREKNQHKVRAHRLVGRALKRGDLVRPDACEECGSTKFQVQAHHDDYSKPLEVRWLCAPCHMSLHAQRSREDSMQPDPHKTYTENWRERTRGETAADNFDAEFDELLARQERFEEYAGQQVTSGAQPPVTVIKGARGSEAGARPDLPRDIPLSPRNDPSSCSRPGSPPRPAASEDERRAA